MSERTALLGAAAFITLMALSLSAHAQEVLRLRLGTSIVGSGIDSVLLPAFTKETGILIDVSASGAGPSLRDARSGGIDILFVNAPEAEAVFMEAGAGAIRKPVMADHYVLVGPKSDPANVAGAASAEEAFRRIARTQSPFVSRGDDSGDAQTELSVWRKAGIEPYGDWYFETGLGVTRSLGIATERGAYMLVDWATWLQAMADGVDRLALLLDGDSSLPDLFSVIAVNPSMNPSVNIDRAQRFVDWLTSEPAQALIRGYEINGTHPFKPMASQGG